MILSDDFNVCSTEKPGSVAGLKFQRQSSMFQIIVHTELITNIQIMSLTI